MGSKAELEKLRARLQRCCEAYKAAPRPRTDAVKRRAIIQSLDAVVKFIQAQPGWDGLEEMLWKMELQLGDIERGLAPSSWLINTKKRPPASISIRWKRGEAAAKMELLMRKNFSRQRAAEKVLEDIPSGSTLLEGSHSNLPTWATVARWRDNVIGRTQGI